MTRTLRFALISPAFVLLTAAYQLPEETMPSLGDSPDAQLTAGICAACHSLDYITHQPPAMGQAFWTAEVTKMRSVYGAPIEDADAARIAAFLASRK